MRRGVGHPLFVLALLATLSGGCAKQPMVTDPAGWRSDKGKVDVQLELIQWHLDRGNTTEAFELLSKLRESGIRSPEMDYLQGTALMKDGLHSEAETILVSAKKRMSKDPRPMRSLGVLYAETERVPEAIAVLEEALKLAPQHAPTLNNLGSST